MPALLRFEESGIEVVPRESVCGIIEVKRALTRRNIQENGAFAHLASIIESIGKSKDLKTDTVLNTANLHVGLHNHSSNKPLLGVIALKNEMNDLNETASLVTTTDSLIDFVWTFDGHALVPKFQDGDQTWFYTHTARPETRTWGKLGSDDFRNAGSPFYEAFPGRPIWGYLRPAVDPSSGEGLGPAGVFARIIGILSLMLSRVCCRPLQEEQINDYYLRSS
jgi:hypothetical protein